MGKEESSCEGSGPSHEGERLLTEKSTSQISVGIDAAIQQVQDQPVQLFTPLLRLAQQVPSHSNGQQLTAADILP